MLFGSVLFHDTGYIVTGVTDGVTVGLAKAMLGEINMNGNLAKYRIVVDSNSDYYGLFTNALIRTQDGKIAFSGLAFDSLGYLLFGVANQSLDSISVFKYRTSNTSTQNGFSLLQEGNSFFIAGIKLDSLASDANVFLTKIDSAGNKLWEKQYHQREYDYAASIIKLSNGNLLLGAGRNDQNLTQQHSNTWLIEVRTTDGSIVRQWFDPNDSTYVAEGLKQTSDGGFIYGAKKKFDQSGIYVNYTATIVKMNTSFNKQWTYTGGYPGELTGFTDVEQLSDGSFVACGKSNYRLGWIVKLNANGQEIWSKNYVGIADAGSENYLTDIDVLPDGGLIAVGECRRLINPNQLPPQVGWFLKLDSNGCEIENCLVGVEDIAPTIEPKQLKSYPNPATDLVRFDYNWVEWEQNAECRIRIADLNGRVVIEQNIPKYSTRQEVSIKKLAAGVYTAMLVGGSGSPFRGLGGSAVIATCKVVKE